MTTVADKFVGFIENPKVFQVNRLPARSYHIPADAVKLNGTWDFVYTPGLRDGLEAAQHWDKQANHDSIAVPGHWQLQGFGSPQYTNIPYPIPVNPPYVPAHNPTGVYHRTFKWTGGDTKLCRLRFDGVDSAHFVFVNGSFVGYAQGSRNPSEFDVTDLLKSDNDLLVVVVQWCDGTYIEDQDQWWLSGIFRDVHLISYDKKGHIEDFHLDTRATGPKAKVAVGTTLSIQSAVSVDVKISDKDGKQVASSVAQYSAGAVHTANFDFVIENAKLWSAESPYLYSVEISMTAENKVIHKVDTHLGIRTTEVRNGNLLVNGVPILLRGVNRHDDNSVRGRAITEDDVIHDLKLMKQYNINAIRCSHYPSHPSLVHWADVLGFYVVDEADLECHGFGEPWQLPDPQLPPTDDKDITRTNPRFNRDPKDFTSDNPLWRDAYVDRAQQLAHRDKNHACVIMWSLGNEAFFGSNHEHMYHWLKENFPLPVHYEQDNAGNQAHLVDVYSRMYPSHDYMEWEAQRPEPKPFILCEYGHAMGNGPGGLKEYQELFYKYPRLQGGFIWEWANHGLRKPLPASAADKSKEYFHAYGGDFNERLHDGTFVMDGLCNSEHMPIPSLNEYKYVIQPVSFEFQELSSTQFAVKIKNLHDFTSLKEFKVVVTAAKIPVVPSAQVEAASFFEKVITITDENDVKAGEKGKFEFTVDTKEAARSNEVILTASLQFAESSSWAEAGHEVAFGQYKIGGSGLSEPETAGSSEDLELTETTAAFEIKSSTVHVTVSKSTGKLTKVAVRDHEVIETGPSLGFWRAPTDNDLGDAVREWQRYRVHLMEESVTAVKAVKLDKGVEIKVHSWIGPAVVQWGLDTRTTYTLHNSAGGLVIDTKVDLDPKGPYCPTLPRIGLDFVVNDSLNRVTWAGLDAETYPDSKLGGKLGVHSSTKEDLFTNYEVPQDNGNRSNIRWVSLSQTGSSGSLLSRLRAVSGPKATEPVLSASADHQLLNFSVQPYDPFELEAAKHPYELDPAARKTHFRVDFEVHGLGSASCGPGVLDKYKLRLGRKSYAVRLVVN